MRTATKLALLATALRVITYLIRRQRALRVRDARPRVKEPIESSDMNVAQNTPF